MALYQEHRPTTLDRVVGNSATVAALAEMLERPAEKRPKALLFEGPSGCGKTTLARIVAEELNAEYNEVDSADFRGIDSIRDLRRRMHRGSLHGKSVRVWLLDECHKLTNEAQNALLKGLEDPPPHCMIMLATTDPDKLLKTVRNRCTRYAVKLLDDGQTFRLLRRTVKDEGAKVGKEVLEKLAEISGGSPRAALTALDKVIGLPQAQQAAAAEHMVSAEEEAADLCRALMDPRKKWKRVAELLKGLKESEDAEGVRRLVLAWAAGVLMKGKDDPSCYIMLDAFREPFYNTGWPGLVLASYEVKVGTSDN